MGKTYRNEPNPERIRRVNELRRSSAPGPHKQKSRKTPDQQAIDDSLAMDWEPQDSEDEPVVLWPYDEEADRIWTEESAEDG